MGCKSLQKKGPENPGPFLFTPTPTYANNRNLKLVWGFIIIALLFIFTAPANADEVSELNQQGLRYMEAGDYENAVIAFESASDLEPDNQIINKNLSTACHYLAGQLAKDRLWLDAIRYEKKAYDKDPSGSAYPKQIAIHYNNYALSLFEKGRYDLALSNFKEALKFDPENITFKDNIYNTTLQEAKTSFNIGRLQEALNLARDCIDYDSSKPAAYVFLGNIYYQQNKLKEAVKDWNKALSLDFTISGLKETLAKATRELEIEEDFKTRARARFDIRFEGKRDPDLVWDIIDTLEDARRKVKSDFGFFTDKKVTVIIYTTEQFKQVTQKLDWALGLYDGKVRLRVGDVLGGQQGPRRVIYHEYGHAVLHILYPKNIPVWLHEGFAQLAEPERSLNQQDKNLLNEILKKEEPFRLNQTDSLFSSADYKKTRSGYLMSKLFLKYLIDRYGKYKFKKLLEKLNSGIVLEKAIYDIYRSHVDDIENDFVETQR